MWEAFLSFFLILHLRKTLQSFSPGSGEIKSLTLALYSVAGLFIISVTLSVYWITVWIWLLLLVLIVIATFKRPEFFPARAVISAFIPLIFLSVLTHLVEKLWYGLYKVIENKTGFLYAVAITWMVAMLIISNKQKKALKIRQEEEKQNKIIAARKAELEILVAERTVEITRQKDELQHALMDLKATQAQLIHREKMASLGELTAGVAHEIQNPLNFVNNFSDVNTELIEELKSEKAKVKSERNDELEDEILNNICQNLEKISFHGKRADAIVKGMLQHSRTSTGQKEPVDINALADEYLHLSYHGLRAKDKSFNSAFATDFDERIGKIEVVPQDIGRVLLNLFNNAFYAVAEKKKARALKGEYYEPKVIVATKRISSPLGAGGLKIHVKDNGVGIPQNVLEKIYQPFFTTKPAGQGTGLGLSISYDIIKAHGGELKVETKEGEGAEFIVQLPIV